MNIADRWQLPDGVEELLPEQALQIEQWRRALLDLFESWGYELVIPPLLEFTESLLIGLGQDLDLQTFKMIDQMSGRMLAVRADITPQTARIDAHSLNRQGVQRLCYAGSVVHTQPAALKASRTPIQIGAELFGEAAVAADIEVICLMLESLSKLGVGELTLDLGHVGIYKALIADAGLDDTIEQQLFQLLQHKNFSDLPAWLQANISDAALADNLQKLANLNGGISVLEEARQCLPASVEISNALNKLQEVAEQIEARYPGAQLYFDLSELRGFNYHTGLVFAAFVPACGRAIANGGRYDDIGAAFGRSRPATGFNMDLKTLLGLAAAPDKAKPAVLAPNVSDDTLWQLICKLRSNGERVQTDFDGASLPTATRYLEKQSNEWVLVEK